MDNFESYLNLMFEHNIIKLVISKPKYKTNKFVKITCEKKTNIYHISKHTQTQVFHSNVNLEELKFFLLEILPYEFLNLNAWSTEIEHIFMFSKKAKLHYKQKHHSNENIKTNDAHNKNKNYLLAEGQIIEPLIDMGIFTKDGKIVKSMSSKYRQINRFLEIIDDVVKKQGKKNLNIIDFGCGKSYLTFIIYYYFTKIKKIDINMVGLDLKEEVILNCNKAVEKYGYNGLNFELGDINGYEAPFDVDIVISLHACDTATDFALHNAIKWNAEMIFSVPCCQHEINSQIDSKQFSILTRYGIISERISALFTDSIRANLLEYVGYDTQLLEFVGFEHTPKNILIRAVKNPRKNEQTKRKAIMEVDNIINEYNLSPTLYNLIQKGEN